MKSNKQSARVYLRKTYPLYLMLIVPIFLIALFSYGPMYGLIIAFKDYFPPLGYLGSPWVGFKNFERFFKSIYAWTYIRNTLVLSVYSLVAGFPIPIILALLLHYVPIKPYKKVVQTVLYAPHFISTVVLVGMLNIFFSNDIGLVNRLLKAFGGQNINFLTSASAFPSLYVWSGIWQNAGWGTVIYMAALAGVDPTLHESAVVEGASIPQRMIYIDLPSILPTVVILLIMNFGSLMGVGFEKAYLMQNGLNMATSEIIATFTYKQGLISRNYSYSAAVGMMNSVVNFILLATVNRISKALGGSSIW